MITQPKGVTLNPTEPVKCTSCKWTGLLMNSQNTVDDICRCPWCGKGVERVTVVNIPGFLEAVAWREVVTRFKSIRDRNHDEMRFDELKWAAMYDAFEELMVLYGDPTVSAPLGVINAPATVRQQNYDPKSTYDPKTNLHGQLHKKVFPQDHEG